MSRFRILFLGTPDFAVASLSELLKDEHFDVAAVVTQPDRPAGRKMKLQASPVKELALQHGLPVFAPETVNTPEFRAQIAALGCESGVVVAFGQILGMKFIELFPHGLVNVHGSLLPRWRGAAPIQRAIMAGDTSTGVALQILVKKLDAGAVLGVRKVEITDDVDAQSLYDRLKILGADLLHVEYMDFLRGNLTPDSQDENAVTIAPKIDKAEARVTWTGPARAVFNHIRGLNMGPVATCITPQGQSLKLHRTAVSREAGELGPPGQILSLSDGVEVACGQGSLRLLEVQPESRSRQAVGEFMRGYSLKVGESFS